MSGKVMQKVDAVQQRGVTGWRIGCAASRRLLVSSKFAS
jgi:hypothetical protein